MFLDSMNRNLNKGQEAGTYQVLSAISVNGEWSHSKTKFLEFCKFLIEEEYESPVYRLVFKQVYQMSKLNHYDLINTLKDIVRSPKRRFGSSSTRGQGFYQQISSFNGSSDGSDTDNMPLCQICGKVGHSALRCCHRFDNNYQDEGFQTTLTSVRITDVSESSSQECDATAMRITDVSESSGQECDATAMSITDVSESSGQECDAVHPYRVTHFLDFSISSWFFLFFALSVLGFSLLFAK